MGTDGIAECFDRCACAKGRRARPGSPARGVSRTLLELVERQGLAGRSVLELGSGLGALSRELVQRGARRADGVELSPVAVAEAIRLAAEAGLAGRTSFTVGDGAVADLTAHDIVVLDKVLCCYPDADRLLSNSARAAASVYGLVAPASSGWRGFVARLALGTVNAWQRVARKAFRVYVHDLGRIGTRLADEGFERAAVARRSMWQVAVYTRSRGREAAVA